MSLCVTCRDGGWKDSIAVSWRCGYDKYWPQSRFSASCKAGCLSPSDSALVLARCLCDTARNPALLTNVCRKLHQKVLQNPQRRIYQTRQTFSLTIFCPGLQAKAWRKSGIFTTTPLIRSFPGQCGSVIAWTRSCSGRSLVQAHCPKPMKNRCSGVKPSCGSRCWAALAFFQAM